MFTLQPLTPLFGAEVTGLDIRSQFSQETASNLYKALLKHRVLLFRNTPLSETEQIRLAEIAGKISVRGGRRNPDPAKLSSMVSNVDKEGLFGDGELSFHSDLSFTEHFLKARSLHALVLPPPGSGGDTLFSDVATAYDDLDEQLKSIVEPLRARFSATYDYGESQETLDYVRPLIGTHPETGRRFIAASRAVTKEVIGMERAEFRPLLKQLWAHMEQSKYIYRHEWELGDTLLWDNIAVQHARTSFDPAQKRSLRAVSVDDPKIAVMEKGDHKAVAL